MSEIPEPCPGVSLNLECEHCGFRADVQETFHQSPGIMCVCFCPRVIWGGAIEQEGFEGMMRRLDAAQEEHDA